MLEVLQFIFSSFWVWAGSVVLLAIVVQGVAAVFAAIAGMFSRH